MMSSMPYITGSERKTRNLVFILFLLRVVMCVFEMVL